MVAIVAGNGLGLVNTSLNVLGSQTGVASSGQSGDKVYVNSTNGNLVIQRQDELVIGSGLDISVVRTYNSQGVLDGDNNDNWRIGFYRQIKSFTAGSTVTRVDADGAELAYTYDATRALYVNKDGAGSFDTLSYNATTLRWSWTDGNTRVVETYDWLAGTGKLLSATDANGNILSYGYTGSLLTLVTDASGEKTYLDYTGNNLTQVRTVKTDGSILTRVHYGYDSNNRLRTVMVDLSPEDNSVTDGKTYTTTYTYDGTSTRVASITQSDGSQVSFGYTLVNGNYCVTSATQAIDATNSRTTTYSYADLLAPPFSAALNVAALSTTQTQTTINSASLIANALVTPTATWGTAALREALTTAGATSPQVAFDQNGNGMATWALGADIFVATYTKATDTWSAAITLDGALTGNPTLPNLSMSANGNALVTWLQNNNVYARRCIAGVWDGATTIPLLENLTTTAASPVGAINDNGRAVVAFRQPTTGTANGLYLNVYNGTAWQTAATVVDDIGTANTNSITVSPSVAIDPLNNATVLWLQKTGTQTVDSLYFSRYTGTTWSTPAGTTLENTTTVVTSAQVLLDANGNGMAVWLQGGSVLAKSYTKSTNTWSTTATTLSTATATVPNLSMSSNGNALVTWIQSGNVLARRYVGGAWVGTAPEAIESLTTTSLNPVGSINNAGQAAIAFVQPTAGTVNDLYVNRFSGTAWQASATLVESNTNSIVATAVPSVALDATGNVNAVWLQKNGTETTDSVFSNRFNASTAGGPYYLVPTGATWASVCLALYGTNNAAAVTALQAAMPGAVLTVGTQLSGWPTSLSYQSTTTVTVPAYYTISANATWTSICQALYGTSDTSAVAALQSAMGSVVLSSVTTLTGLPTTLAYGLPVKVGEATSVKDALGNITVYNSDLQGHLKTVVEPAVNGTSQTLIYNYDADGNVATTTDAAGNQTTYAYDANGNQTLQRDAAGNTVTRTYGSKNELLTETIYATPDPDGSGALQPGTPLTTRYAYDANNHLRFTVSAEGRVTEYRYDGYGQRVTEIIYKQDLYSVTALSQTTSIAESSLSTWVSGLTNKVINLRTDFLYDFRGNISSTRRYEKLLVNGDVPVLTVADSTGYVHDNTRTQTQVINYVYDQAGNLLQKQARTTAIDALETAATEVYTYDGLGRVLTATGLANGATLYQYDDANAKTAVTLANGLVTTSAYDKAGELLSVTDSSAGLGQR